MKLEDFSSGIYLIFEKKKKEKKRKHVDYIKISKNS